jgi:glycosyltransferase involved in cell wall biosynthesis
MTHAVSIVMPAYAAERTIGDAVASVIAQTHEAWELIVVADDETDYGAVLGRAGLADGRIRHLATGTVAGGSPVARNLGLDAASHRYSAILDADDRFHPHKLERALAALEARALVSTALSVTDARYRPLRTVAAGDDRVLTPGEYKFVNFSMDSMLVYDRLAADPRFDATLPCLTDLDFVLKLFGKIKSCRHLGTPLHDYVKHPTSVSNKPGASARMAETKTLLLERLEAGYYPFAAPEAVGGFRRFIEASLAAERDFPDAAALVPGLLFEDHLERYLRGKP